MKTRSRDLVPAFHIGTIVLSALLWVTWLVSLTFLYARPQSWRLDVSGYDWHVYQAGADDLVARTLYRVPLIHPTAVLPIEVFNLPPMAAAWALLFGLLGSTGGPAWVILQALGTAAGVWLVLRALGLQAWLWTGVLLAVWQLAPWYSADLLLGNINGLMTLLVGAFLALHLGGRPRASGLMLGLAIATKLWPVAFVPLLIRERRWIELRWAVGVIVVQAVLFLAWLGPDVVPAMVSALGHAATVSDRVPVFWVSAMRRIVEWWPAWAGAGIGLALVAIPAKGRAGLGLAILAGLAVVPNVWQHYLATLIIAGALLLAGITRWRDGPARPPPHPTTVSGADVHGPAGGQPT